MNFNEEMMEELAELELGGHLITIAEEDKGTSQDYIALEKKLAVKDMETTRMIRESSRNAKLSLPCESSIVQSAVELRQFLSKSSYGIDEIIRIYMNTPVSDYFKYLNNFDSSDFGIVNNAKPKRKLQKRNYFL